MPYFDKRKLDTYISEFSKESGLGFKLESCMDHHRLTLPDGTSFSPRMRVVQLYEWLITFREGYYLGAKIGLRNLGNTVVNKV